MIVENYRIKFRPPILLTKKGSKVINPYCPYGFSDAGCRIWRLLKMDIVCIKGVSLNTTVYRGFARARDLAEISEPDVFDQKTNPDGTQRDLKEWHARQAHAYGSGKISRQTTQRIWPEVLLNVRDTKVVGVGNPDSNGFVKIDVFEEKIENRHGVNPQISRVDGNHRLFYAAGYSDKKRKVELDPLDSLIPFSITVGLDKKEEAALFGDINGNAVKINTSHLDHLRYRLIGDEAIKKEEVALWIAEELAKDQESPFYNCVYLGGKRTKGNSYLLSLDTLKEGLTTLLNRSKELPKDEIPFELKSKAIRNFWRAIKNTFLEEWTGLLTKPKSNLLLSYFGYLALSRLGSDIIDTSIRHACPTIDYMQQQLLGIKNNVKWTKDGTFKGYGGKGGSDTAYEEMKKWLPVDYKLEEVLRKLRES
jgi:DGQHR domain-containing protein